jgi:SET domain-containing protein
MLTINEKDKRFYIAESTQKNAGLGLFASESIEKGEYLEVIGVMVDKDSISDHCTAYANHFKFAADYSDSFTKHIIPLGYGGIVNHANEKQDQNVEIRYIKKGKESICVYWFLKDVKKDEEVLGNYGEGWNSMSRWVENVDLNEEDHQEEWDSFLSLGLYNLGKLKRFEKNAKH